MMRCHKVPQLATDMTLCRWWSPETLAEQRFTTKSDIFSLGALLSELWSGEIPYATIEDQHLGSHLSMRPFPSLDPIYHCPQAVSDRHHPARLPRLDIPLDSLLSPREPKGPPSSDHSCKHVVTIHRPRRLEGIVVRLDACV